MSLIPLKRNKQEWDHDNHPYSFDNPNIYMRPATENDVDNMYSWEMESIDKSLQEDSKVQQLIRDDCYQSIKDTQMIMDQDKTIGMFTACMIDNGEWRYIGEIYLIPEYRGQHIGSTILKNEIANYDRIRLQVAYDNENALRLYKSLGFKIVKENKEAKLYIMEYDKSLPVTEAFFKEAYLKAKERNSLKDSEFGIPELRKYPLTDETHINMAVKFFGKAPKKYKLSLAKRILRAAHSHDMDTDGWDTINDYIKNHKESVVQEGFVDRTIKHTLSGLKIPKLQPVDEKYLMDHKADYMKLKKSNYFDFHRPTFEKICGENWKELKDNLLNLFLHMGYAKDYNIYNKYRLFLCKLLNLPTDCAISINLMGKGMGNLFLNSKEDAEGIHLKPTDVLYHTSHVKGLTELHPSFVSRNQVSPFDDGKNLLAVEVLYPSPRVYVSLNDIITRGGFTGSGAVEKDPGLRVYKITNFKGKVKTDKELRGGPARYIETKSPVKVVDVTEEYLSKHTKESTVTEAAYAKGINRANTRSVVIVYKRFSTKNDEQYGPIKKFWEISDKYFTEPHMTSGFGWDWTDRPDFAYGIIINEKNIPDEFMKEMKATFPDVKLDKHFLIPNKYEQVFTCPLKTCQETYDKIWSKGPLECELEDYPSEGQMKISVIYQKDKAKLENEVSKHIKTVTNVQNPTGKEVKNPINESYTERKNFIMKEQITKILEAYNSGVLTQEEASEKIEAIQEQVVTESAVNTTDDLRVKQEKIMESFKMGIINGTEGMRLIERVMMEADYITEEEDTAYEGDDDNEPEDITPEDTDGDTVDSDDTNIDALADYINSLSDDEKTALMSKLSGSDEPTDDDANGNEEVPTEGEPEGEPTTEETVDPASVSDASLNDANASLDDMEV